MGKCEGKREKIGFMFWVLGFCYLVGFYGNDVVFFSYHVFDVPNRELGFISCLRVLKFTYLGTCKIYRPHPCCVMLGFLWWEIEQS
jgi:hypothetical protein